MCIHICNVHMHMHICAYIYVMYMCTCIYVPMHICTYMCIFMYMYTYVCIHVCVYILFTYVELIYWETFLFAFYFPLVKKKRHILKNCCLL